MKNILRRFLAYLIAGFSSGFAVWLYFQSWSGLVTGLGFAALALGLPAAMYLFRKAYDVPRNGMRTNPAWSAFASDAICLVAAATAVFFIIDGYSAQFDGFSPMLGEPLLSDVILFMLLPAAFVLAAVVTQSAGQSVAVNSKGIVVTGPSRVAKLNWQEIELFRPDSQYVMVSRVGVPVPKRLRTNLEVITRSGETVTIYEPGLARDRKAILSAFVHYAPSGLQDDLADIESAWS